MRGTLETVRSGHAQTGIIPAYAGNTRQQPRRCRQNRDHPRVCGEHVQGDKITLDEAGSSPRMRGTPYPLLYLSFLFGIIPAYAGNTDTTKQAFVDAGDHPRVCGEHLA